MELSGTSATIKFLDVLSLKTCDEKLLKQESNDERAPIAYVTSLCQFSDCLLLTACHPEAVLKKARI